MLGLVIIVMGEVSSTSTVTGHRGVHSVPPQVNPGLYLKVLQTTTTSDAHLAGFAMDSHPLHSH